MSPETIPSRRFLFGIALSMLLVGAAAAAVMMADDPGTPAPVGQNASEEYAAVDGLTATVTTVVERGGERDRTVSHVSMQPAAGRVFLERVSGSSADPEVVVSNGSVKWAYDEDEGLVYRTEAAALAARLQNRGDRIQRLFRRAEGTAVTTADRPTRTPGVSPLPAIPYGQDATTSVGANVTGGDFAVSYDGTATVAGRQTHVLSLRSTGESSEAGPAETDVTQTIWVDATHSVPLKYRTDWTEAGERVERTVTLSNVSFEPGLSADRFRFETPTDAAVVTPGLGTDAAERIESIDGIDTTVRTRIGGLGLNATNASANRSANGSRYETIARLQARPGTGERRLERRGGPELGADLFVSNGSTTWLYDRSANNVTRTDAAQLNGDLFVQQGEQIERLFARLERTRTEPPDVDGSPGGPGAVGFPGTAVAGPGAAFAVPSSEVDQYGIDLVGAEQVDGRTAYVLRIEATDGDETPDTYENYSRTMWIDAELFVPLKQRTQWSRADGDPITAVVTYTNVTVNPDFEPGTFEFEPPANATVSASPLDGIESYDSRRALVANASLSVPDPTVPPDFAFDGAQRFQSGNTTLITLAYTNETARLAVSRAAYEGRPTNLTANRTRGRRVTIGDRSGTYSRLGPSASVAWVCGESRYSVSGTAVSRPLLIRVAESIDCG